MTIAILCDQPTKAEILEKGIDPAVEVIWADSSSSLRMIESAAWFDLQFRKDPERIQSLAGLSPLFIGANDITCDQLPKGVYRINTWPGMINRRIMEITTMDGNDRIQAEQVLQSMGWESEWVQDIPGFISSRIIAGIINEAYYTYEAGTSSKEDIDIALKLGTNYPFGPFEWCKKIGAENVISLLHEISHKDDRYTPCDLLIKEQNELDT